jgi:hypothetical protein
LRPGCNDGDLDRDAAVTGREEDEYRRWCNGGGSELSEVLDVDADAVTEEEEPEDVVVDSNGGFIGEDADAVLEVVDCRCNGIGCVEGARFSRSSMWRDRSISLSCSSASCVTFLVPFPNWDPHLSIGNDALEVEGVSK